MSAVIALETLRRANIRRHSEGLRLRAAIRAADERYSSRAPASAKQILRTLQPSEIGRDELPSLRTVQWHLQEIRRHPALRA
jgi:hypothetical protein